MFVLSIGLIDAKTCKMKSIEMVRFDNRVKITSAFGNVTIEDFINVCEDNDFSLDSYITGHLMLLDDRCGVTYMLNDYGVNVIDVLNECGNFTAPLSVLEYSLFQTI